MVTRIPGRIRLESGAPNQTLADTFEEPNRPFCLGSLKWLGLKWDQQNAQKIAKKCRAYHNTFHRTENAIRECFATRGDTVATNLSVR